MNLIITKADIQDYKVISKALSIDKTDEYIREAQEIDLMELVPKLFYFDLVKKFQDAKYQKLIHGDVYTVDGVEIQFNGLKPVLAYFAYSRLAIRGDVVNTPFGFEQKRNEWGDRVSGTEKRDMRDEARQIANSYFVQVVDYIMENKELYPLFFEHQCKRNNINKINISKI